MGKKIKIKKIASPPSQQISKKQKQLFIIITLLTPLIFFMVFEIILRLINYGGDLQLFIPSTEGYEKYLRCNPNVARRYFFMQHSVPTPSKDLFLVDKPADMYRIFVMGGSTTAGFPYGNNMMFSRILQKQLESVYPNQKFEIINVATSAINSYSLLDFIDEILEQKPDLILIYAGHNEYYGALGVGSVESLGGMRWLIRSYLSLQRLKTFILLRDMIGYAKKLFSDNINEDAKINPSATLMARIVSKQTIPLHSDLYEAGKNQFQENMDKILNKINEKKVNVIISELISNIHDQIPFISVESKNRPSANEKFKEARILESAGKIDQAKKAYYEAKDLDELRFRAPEEFNSIIHSLAKKYNADVVPMKSYFEKYSRNGLIGNELILEHLHPNDHGYYLMSTAFLNEIIKSNIVNSNVNTIIEPDYQSFLTLWGFTQLDKDFAKLTINNLKNGWPFKPKATINRFVQNYKPNTITEKLALKILSDPNFGIEQGHLELAKYYENQSDFKNAFAEYKALIFMIPYETEFYEKAAIVLLTMKDYNSAEKVLQQSLNYKESYFAIKWLGQIALMNLDYATAIRYLEKGRNIKSNDSQLLFNLGRAYYYSGDRSSGDEMLNNLRQIEPNSAYSKNLQKISKN